MPSGFENRLQEYLQIVQDNVEKGTLEAKYEDYIKDIIAVVKKATNERIRLALPETKDPIRKNKILLDRKSEIQSYEAQNDMLSEMAHALAQEVARLKSYEFFDEVYEFFTLEQKLEEFDKMIGEIKNVGSLGYRSVIAQKEALLAQKNQMPDRRKEVLTKISQFAPIAKRIEDLLAQKEKNEKNQKALEKYAKAVLELEAKIKALEEENAQISTTGVFSDEEKKAYERYLYCKKMLFSVQRVVKAQDYRKLNLSANEAKEIFDYTNQALMLEVGTLGNLPIVKYRLNRADIEKMQEQLDKENLRAKQSEIALVDNTEAEILQECQGKTIQEFLDEYNALKEEAKIIEGIRNIGQKMQKLNKTNSQIDSNNIIFEKLKEFPEMSNMAYNSLIGQLYFDVN